MNTYKSVLKQDQLIPEIHIEKQEDNKIQTVIFLKKYNSYNQWRYAYDKYLTQIANTIEKEFDLVFNHELFFHLLYEKSTGKISKYI